MLSVVSLKVQHQYCDKECDQSYHMIAILLNLISRLVIGYSF